MDSEQIAKTQTWTQGMLQTVTHAPFGWDIMKLKRGHTSGVHKVVPTKHTGNLGQGSRFVKCPLCRANLAWHTINAHLDTAHALANDSTCSRPASGASGGSDCTKTSSSDPVRQASKLYQIPDSRTCHKVIILLLLFVRGVFQPRRPQQDNITTDSESQPNHKHQQLWWQTNGPSNHSLAAAKLTTSTRQATPLMDDELCLLTPCEVVRDALPAKLANTLLKDLMSDAATWTRGTWYMGGKEHTAPRTSSYYTLRDVEVCSQAAQVQLSNLSISRLSSVLQTWCRKQQVSVHLMILLRMSLQVWIHKWLRLSWRKLPPLCLNMSTA